MINVQYSSNTERQSVIFDENKPLAELLDSFDKPENASISVNGFVVSSAEFHKPLKDFTNGASSCYVNALRKTDHN